MVDVSIFSLEGKSGFITGGAQGIGKCIANAYCKAGANVAIVDINMEKAEVTAKELSEVTGRKCIAYQCNVTDPVSVDKMMADYMEDYGKIDFAVNNAGIFTGDPAMEIEYDDFKRVIDINLNGVFLTARAAAKEMEKSKKGGSIISTASMSGHVINVPQTIANYCASKAGVVQLSKAMAVEWAKYGIRSNTVSPGYIQTDLIATMKDMLETWSAKMPEGSRLGYPEDLVGMYIYLASDASKWSTGADYIVDGGYTAL